MRPLILICFILIVTSKISSQTSNNFSFNQIQSSKIASQFSILYEDTLDLNIPGEKSPWLAFLFSYIFPGGGQIYNGQPVKGLLFLTGITAGVGLAVLSYGGSDFENTNDSESLIYGGLGLAALLYIYQLIDAPVSASSINEERRIKLNKVELGLLPQITGSRFNTTFKIYFY